MKTKFFYGMTALATLGLAACTSEDLAPSKDQIAEADMTRYISVQISNPNLGTRADNEPSFSPGEGKENDVHKLYFVFYDKDNNVVGDIVNVDKFTFVDQPTNPAPSNNKIASAVVGVNIQRNEKLPAGVLVYVNPVTPDGMLNPVNVIETLKRTAVINGDGHFPMSNSVYFDEKGNVYNLAKIPEDGLFETEAKAQDALDNPNDPVNPDDANDDRTKDKLVTNIYVERYAAKVGLMWAPKITVDDQTNPNNTPEYKGVSSYTYTVTGGTITETKTDVTLKFVPTNWDVNAEGKDMFIMKCFRQQDQLGTLTQTNYTFAEAEKSTLLGPNNAESNWIWNQHPNHRSYWACSPAYYSTAYPEVASDYVISDEGDDIVTNPNMLLNYLRWKDVKNTVKPVTTGDVNTKENWTYDYVRETTVGTLGLQKTPNHYASIPSIIVVGNYNIKFGEEDLNPKTTFYLYSSGDNSEKSIFFEAATGEGGKPLLTSAVTNKAGDAVGTSLLERMGRRQQTLWVKVATKEKPEDTNPTIEYRSLTDEELGQVLKVAHPTKEVLDAGQADAADGKNVKLAARRYTIQLTNNLALSSDDELVSYTLQYNDGTGYKDIPVQTGDDLTQDMKKTLNTVNMMLARNVGYADKYKDGMAYFNIPIKHYGWYRTGNKNVGKDKLDWNDTRVGDFGIVRNHIYQIQVTKVDGLATGIASEYTPIIPAQETEEHFIAYRLHILNWAILPVQNAEL